VGTETLQKRGMSISPTSVTGAEYWKHVCNRDHNAATNMYEIIENTLLGRGRPKCFTRT